MGWKAIAGRPISDSDDLVHRLVRFFLVLGVVVVLLTAYAMVGTPEFEDELILEQHLAEVSAKRSIHPCDATMKQWGPAERWAPKGEEQEPECVARAKRLPPYLLTAPLGSAK